MNASCKLTSKLSSCRQWAHQVASLALLQQKQPGLRSWAFVGSRPFVGLGSQRIPVVRRTASTHRAVVPLQRRRSVAAASAASDRNGSTNAAVDGTHMLLEILFILCPLNLRLVLLCGSEACVHLLQLGVSEELGINHVATASEAYIQLHNFGISGELGIKYATVASEACVHLGLVKTWAIDMLQWLLKLMYIHNILVLEHA
jgi:hypothetical protein